MWNADRLLFIICLMAASNWSCLTVGFYLPFYNVQSLHRFANKCCVEFDAVFAITKQVLSRLRGWLKTNVMILPRAKQRTSYFTFIRVIVMVMFLYHDLWLHQKDDQMMWSFDDGYHIANIWDVNKNVIFQYPANPYPTITLKKANHKICIDACIAHASWHVKETTGFGPDIAQHHSTYAFTCLPAASWCCLLWATSIHVESFLT